MPKTQDRNIKCSFCGKPQEVVKKIIAGPNVFICDECVGLCQDIIDEEIYDEEVDLKNNEIALKKVKDGSIKFKDVSFNYAKKHKKECLKNINSKNNNNIKQKIKL